MSGVLTLLAHRERLLARRAATRAVLLAALGDETLPGRELLVHRTAAALRACVAAIAATDRAIAAGCVGEVVARRAVS